MRVAASPGALFVIATVAFYQLTVVFAGEKLSFLYKDELHLTASQVTTIVIIMGIPAYLRPLMGAASDVLPIWGYHRKSYYAMSWMFQALSLASIAVLYRHGWLTVVSLLLVFASGTNLLFVVMDAVMVRVGNANGSIGRLQSAQQSVPFIIGLTFGGPLSGYVTQHWSYEACFIAGCISSMSGVLLTTLIKDDPRRHATAEELRSKPQWKISLWLFRGALSPGFFILLSYIFYLLLTPGINTARFYYMVDALHLSKQTIGNLRIPGSAGQLIGLLAFALVSSRLPVLYLAVAALVGDCFDYIFCFGLRDVVSAYLVVFSINISGAIYNMSLLTLAAKACPRQIEATIYGLLMGTILLGGALSEKLGSSLYDHFGPANSYSISHGWLVTITCGLVATILGVCFFPFLPAWCKSREPIGSGRDSLLPSTNEIGFVEET